MSADRKIYRLGDGSWSKAIEVIDMLNHNVKVDGEPSIPIKATDDYDGWYVECLNRSDEPRLEKHLDYIFGITD